MTPENKLKALHTVSAWSSEHGERVGATKSREQVQ
jgi:hypothetical protein